LKFVIAAAAILIIILLVKRAAQVSAGQAAELAGQGALLLDVRTAEEFSRGHVSGATNLPLSDIANGIESIQSDRDRPVLMYCLSGTRSQAAVGILRKKGYQNVHNLGSIGRARKVLKK